MNLRDIVLQMNVYHTINVQYGRGTVKKIIRKKHTDTTEVLVTFAGIPEEVLCKAGELRKSPNRSRIKMMLVEYSRKGIDAIDGWDCVVLPESRGV